MSTLEGCGLVALLASGCAAHVALPMTAQELERDGSAEALVAYLSQPDASASVCDPESRGPYLPVYAKPYRQQLVDALVAGKITPKLFTRCVDLALRKAPEDDARSLQDAVAKGYRKLLVRPEVELNPAEGERLAELNSLYLMRKVRIGGHDEVLRPMFDELRKAIDEHRLGPVASRLGGELLATAEVEQGRWQGKPVDAAMIDALAKAGEVGTLERFVERLPNEGLRDEAKRRVIRFHIAASPYPEVQQNAAQVEQTLMEKGGNPVALGGQRLVRAWIDTEHAPMRTVFVQQDVWAQTARLTAAAPGRAGESVLPEISLRHLLVAEVSSVSLPITVCEPPHALDPSPCIAPEDVAIDHPLAYVDRGARFHFNDSVAMSQVTPLAGADELVLPVKIAGVPATVIQWTLHFERPDNLVLSGDRPGANGPPMRVQVDASNPQRFVLDASTPARRYLLVLEASDLNSYRVASRGAQGRTGDTGTSGSNGAMGGDCQNGSQGGDGGPGGPGGPGGNGGDVRVQVSCGDRPCPELSGLLYQLVRSEGGAGGSGGEGGPGGAGGSGGMSRPPTTHIDSSGATVTDDPGCIGGAMGASGSRGPSGPAGRPGRPGNVSVTVSNRAAPL